MQLAVEFSCTESRKKKIFLKWRLLQVLKASPANATYPPVSQMCVLPGGECSCKRRNGNTLGGRSSPRRWVSPSRTPAWSRSGRCRCRPTQEGSPYAPHTERKKASIGLDFWKILSSKLLGPFSSKRHLRRGRKRTPKQKHTYQEQTARLQHKETVKAAKLVTIKESVAFESCKVAEAVYESF